MADPISLLAMGALVFAARQLSNEARSSNPEPEAEAEAEAAPEMEMRTETVADPFRINGAQDFRIEKEVQPSFGDVGFLRYPRGEPVRDFRSRPYVSGTMNNLSPVEKQLVGPGLGLSADIPAYGGYQQLYRVQPNNVGAYKLTTLPGRSGPAGPAVTGGKRGIIGELTHNDPPKTAFLPTRRPNVPGRAQGQGGALSGVTVRSRYEKAKRTTNRSETTMRKDGLQYAPAKRFVNATTLAQDPTRNKGDLNVLQYSHVNNPAPGISSFHGAYTTAPVQLRAADRRGKKDRSGNPGRMNVRADALNQGGLVTAVRSDTSRVDGRVNSANAGWTQNYVQSTYSQTNSYKGNTNPHASNKSLDIAKNQLMANPLAHTLSV